MPLFLLQCRWKWGPLCIECPIYNSSIRDKFPSLIQNVMLGSLKSSYFNLDHWVDISLHYSRKLVSLSPSSCTSCPMSVLDSDFHFIASINLGKLAITFLKNNWLYVVMTMNTYIHECRWMCRRVWTQYTSTLQTHKFSPARLVTWLTGSKRVWARP